MIIKEKANAKLNLALCVLSKRSDGYHEMDMLNQSVSLFDEVTVERTGEEIILKTDLQLADPEKDLTVKAARAFFAALGNSFGVKITVKKNIPVLAGLGGGSADAAAVLRALNRLAGNAFEPNDLIKIAKSVGADVPFCLVGGTARVQGIGDKIVPIKKLFDCTFLLVRCGQKLSTADMFSRLDGVGCARADLSIVQRAIENGDKNGFCKAVSNSFDALYDNADVKQIILSFGGKAALTTGSGPVLYGVFFDEVAAIACLNHLKQEGYSCWCCKPE